MAQTAPPEPPPRGIPNRYLHTPEGIRDWFQAAKKQNVTVTVASALLWGESWYKGSVSPRAEALAGQPESFDPLQAALDLGHAAGMKVYASFDVGDIWNRGEWPKSPAHVVNAHPDWLLVDRNGKMFPAPGPDPKRVFLDPGSPAARKWVHDIVLDVVKRYRVDGIVLSGLGYPGPGMGFSDEDLAQFRTMLDPDLTREQKDALALLPERDAWTRMFPARWAQWRRDNVTGLLRRISRDAKTAKPGLTVAAFVTARGPVTAWEDSLAYAAFSQDWFGWMKEGIVDAVIPSAQHAHRDEYEGWVRAARENRGSAQVWANKWSDKMWDIIEQKNTEAAAKVIRDIHD